MVTCRAGILAAFRRLEMVQITQSSAPQALPRDTWALSKLTTLDAIPGLQTVPYHSRAEVEARPLVPIPQRDPQKKRKLPDWPVTMTLQPRACLTVELQLDRFVANR